MFEVWAPGRQRVDVLLGGDRRWAMAKGDRGWWRLDVPAAAGDRYQFSLDGGPARPDPRSAWQPEGVDGPSVLVDHGSFTWTDQDWHGAALSETVLYELHVGTFSPEGTFDGAVSRLEHLVDLGANAIELLPVAEASGSRGWGYDGADLWAPHHAYGGPDGLKRLVDACHARGIAVVLDVVYNHLGPAGNYLSEFGPYFTDDYRTPWGSAVNMDGNGSYGVRDFVISNALMWLRDYHIDGLRLDAVHAIYDEGALHILEELSAAVAGQAGELGRELWVIAESDRNDPRLCRPRESHGYGVSASWDDDFHHALHTVLTGENSGYYIDFGRVAQLAKVFSDAYVYDGEFSEFRQRRHGRPAQDLSGACFVCCLQNHDQVGNRAFGERTAALVGPDLLKVGAALVLLSPFVPMLFEGEEWGASTPFLYFTDHQDPELGAAVREGRRKEHPLNAGAEVPDPQGPETFLRSKLDWSELDREPHRSLLAWHRRLIALRRSEPDLSSHDRKLVSTAFDEEARWLVANRGRFSIAANLAGRRQAVPLEGGVSVVAASEEGVRVEISAGEARAWLPPRSVAVLAH
ncbi:MAG: malto-oligosyltrehalose trehalohydrolase [Acidimicrobiales bacterium]